MKKKKNKMNKNFTPILGNTKQCQNFDIYILILMSGFF